jgi:hypothetical protein
MPDPDDDGEDRAAAAAGAGDGLLRAYRASYAEADAPSAYDTPAWQSADGDGDGDGWHDAPSPAEARWPAPLYSYAAQGTQHDLLSRAVRDPATGEPADALEPTAAGDAAAAAGGTAAAAKTTGVTAPAPALAVPRESWAAERLPEVGVGGRYVTAGPDALDVEDPADPAAPPVRCPDGDPCVYR